MDFKSAMAAARAEAESRQRKKRRDKDEKSEKKRSRSGEDMGLESFDPVNYVAKERAETATLYLADTQWGRAPRTPEETAHYLQQFSQAPIPLSPQRQTFNYKTWVIIIEELETVFKQSAKT